MAGIGKKVWAIAEGYIPMDDETKDRRFVSHETACILNPNSVDAKIDLTLYFTDKEPVKYGVFVKAQRTLHLRFNDLEGPLVPRDTDFSALFVSDNPVIIQHSRLDSRSADLALLSTLAYSE